jgi:hypothetical protein
MIEKIIFIILLFTLMQIPAARPPWAPESIADLSNRELASFLGMGCVTSRQT